jgi:hypothetical protein
LHASGDAMGNGQSFYKSDVRKLVEIAATVAVTCIVTGAAILPITQPAQALPSFARQTGQPCGTCHTDFPGLTPFGRRFKLGGYTTGGGDFRTTLFPFPRSGKVFPSYDDFKAVLSPSTTDSQKSSYAAEKGDNSQLPIYKALASPADNEDKGWVPPLSMMAVIGFTHTQAPQDPTGSPWKPNDNVAAAPVSFFYGGAITEHIGAFAQGTYNGPGMGMPSDPFTHNWSWDNTDIRYANTTKIGDMDVIYGITANNSPTVQDVWNTTPAWKFPYASSNLAPTPGASTLIDGALAQHVGSVGGYLFINDMFYLEATGYKTLSFNAQNKLGTDPLGAPGLTQGIAPYFRVALEPHWGNNWLQLGAFVMKADIHPWDPVLAPSAATLSATDKYTDVGVDSQYQYQGQNYWFTLRGTFIHENQKLDATFGSGGSDNLTEKLNTVRAQASLAYGNYNRVVLTGQYFNTWGTSDATLYMTNASGFSPNSNGFTTEIAYIPFNMSKSPIWPWFNSRIGLQYTYYNKFDGTTVNAKNNNTLFLYLWVAM